MPHTLEFIGFNNNTYTTTEGGSTPEIQSVGLNQIIESVYLTGRSVAEQTGDLKFYEVSTHPYKKKVNGSVVTDTVSAVDMPCYLGGWKTASNYLIPVGQILNQQFISAHFTQGQTNLDLFGKWGETRLIRAIVYLQKDNQTPQDVRYNVTISAISSYDTSIPYYLTNNFKTISDTGNDLEYTNGSRLITEYGYGHGCPSDGVIHYYGVKDCDGVSISLTPDANYTNNFIPYYEIINNSVVYKCYIIDNLCREEASPHIAYANNVEAITYNPNTNTWTVENTQPSIAEIDTDKTVFFPLIEKPTVTVNASPVAGGTVYGGGTFMPGDSCEILAIPASGYSFVQWKKNNTAFVPQVTTALYTFTVLESTAMTAVFMSSEPNVYLSYLTSDGNTITPGFVKYVVDPYGSLPVSYEMGMSFGVPNALFFENGTTIQLQCYRAFYNYTFGGWYSYTGNTRNPQTDTLLTEDNDEDETLVYSHFTFTVGESQCKYYAYLVVNQ